MAKGLLEIQGKIALAQFWPDGESDADTTKVKVEVGDDAFRFQEHPALAFHVTHAFDKAKVRGRVSKEIIDAKSRITIRLQGVDAPELHYMPQAARKRAEQTATQREVFLELNHKYRQPFAESATVALKDLLAGTGQPDLFCRVLTAVDQPADAIDTYGRLVGDIEVTLGGVTTNLNRWLVSRGWTVPAFYNSMANDEIQALLDLAEEARREGRGFWPRLAKTVGTLDFDLRYRKVAPPDDVDDSGTVLMPKLFRRLSTFAVNKKAKMVTGTFRTYLKKKADFYYLLEDFLAQGPTAADPRNLSDVVGAGQKLLRRPQDLVFHEEGARLLGPSGETPTW